jgi:hypothetical protein
MSACPPEAVVTCAISDRFVDQPKRIGSVKGDGRGRITAARQDVDDDRRREDAVIQRLFAGRLDRHQAIGDNTSEDGSAR